mmetsp:Transcript_3065/g.8642  ORF Transcript_3065/g.8642 Transcript_3065/m.8642 type:complete len:139 (-) Transcript_3065:44-460(-)
MEGLGSYYGTFNQVQASGPYGKFGKWQNMKTTDEFDKRTKDSAAKSTEPRNFYTSPSKSGHIGLLGCVKGTSGVTGEYKYEMNPPLSRPKREELKPFKPSSPAKRGLFSQARGREGSRRSVAARLVCGKGRAGSDQAS